jgi:tetratricopeptide (TPR) repeat protein
LNLTNANKQALPIINNALNLEPENAEALYGKGRILFALGNYAEALVFLQKMLTIEDSVGESWHYTGLTLEKLDRYDEAKQYFDKAKELGYHN